MIGGLFTEFTGHAQMDSQPTVRIDPEEHLFRRRLGGDQMFAVHSLDELIGIAGTKDAGPTMEVHTHDRIVQTRIPSLTKILHLSEFWHDGQSGVAATTEGAVRDGERRKRPAQRE